jgi:hypothetical protein
MRARRGFTAKATVLAKVQPSASRSCPFTF